MSTQENQKRWIFAMRAKGHTPKMSGDNLDYFALESGHHNGPGCNTCGWSCCWHCEDIDEIPECADPRHELTATETNAALCVTTGKN